MTRVILYRMEVEDQGNAESGPRLCSFPVEEIMSGSLQDCAARMAALQQENPGEIYQLAAEEDDEELYLARALMPVMPSRNPLLQVLDARSDVAWKNFQASTTQEARDTWKTVLREIASIRREVLMLLAKE